MATRKPSVMNAPGGSTKSNILRDSGRSVIPNTEPAPSISRTTPSAVRPIVKPKPIPIPSKILSIGPFLQAKASARPRMIQFTTISGINNPSVA